MWHSAAQKHWMYTALHKGTHGITQAIVDKHEAETPKDARLPAYSTARKRLAASLQQNKRAAAKESEQ